MAPLSEAQLSIPIEADPASVDSQGAVGGVPNPALRDPASQGSDSLNEPGVRSLAAGSDVSQVVEHLFRHEAGKMVAMLTHIFGVDYLTLAEDVVQEALVKALRIWPFYGVPKNPSAWIMRTCRNLALDVIRREKVFREKEPEIIARMDRESPSPDAMVLEDQEIADDRLRLMFVCCHPVLPLEAQVSLALNTLCGFSVSEISRAFLSSEAAIAKRLTRAKQRIREEHIPFEIPTGAELSRRLDGVLKCLYLLFNEGYKASSGVRLVRPETCHAAIRLATLLAKHPLCDQPQTHALLALLLLTTARFPTRSDAEGNLLRLQDQDRSLWDRVLIARGMYHLARSAAGSDLSEYHIQAAIMATHCAAKDYDSTDWKLILRLYDQLIQINDSPIVALNRAVALANVEGAVAGIAAVETIRHQSELHSYYLLYAVLGDFEMRRSNHQAAALHFRQALSLACLDSERSFLSRRAETCEQTYGITL